MGQDACGDWDESPAHSVTISKPFFISATEVTLEQFRRFRPQHEAATAGKATGVSWHDAVAFCEWLSKQEGKSYRLPTEAEWEYACRAGTATAFWSGDQPPADHNTPNPWGLRNLHDKTMEWCLDWHGEYRAEAQTDPVGPDHGLARVVRGDKPDDDHEAVKAERPLTPYYHRSANRAGLPPAFGIPPAERGKTAPKPTDVKDTDWSASGPHTVGFRVVQAPLPTSSPYPAAVPFVRQGVKPPNALVKQAPPATQPYFRKRYLLPTPPEPGDRQENGDTARAGLHPSFRRHAHSPGLAACPNGDLLLIIYTSGNQGPSCEYETRVALMAARLRFGADQWDMPDPLVDIPDANDHAPLLWTDWTKGGRLCLFWGSPRIAQGAFPFQWVTSDDSGAIWSEVRYPFFPGPVGAHTRQPINTAVLGLDGTLYVASDALGASSVLWGTRDNGETWHDTVGRSAGRHTTYCLLKDGRLLGMGGKNSDLGGFMPKVISADGGKTWVKSKTPFSPLSFNQRPSVLRLTSGRLFMAGDFQPNKGERSPVITNSGAYVALSDDQGETWRTKLIPVAQPHEDERVQQAPTLGYSAAQQAPNGLIHLITTMNDPCLHFEMNEAWILSDVDAKATDADLMPSNTKSLTDIKPFEEKYASGTIRATWQAGVGDDGRYLLTGDEAWFFESGRQHYEARYVMGQKIGTETLYRPDGSVEWQRQYRPDGSHVWTQYWESGQKKAQSAWRNLHAEGPAKLWDRTGKLISDVTFTAGTILPNKQTP
jgi:hypothetical protein